MSKPRPEIEQLALVPHGGFESARESPVLDFSANVNPYGPSPKIWEAMRAVSVGQHPDPRALPLRQFLAEREKIDARQLLVGNGSIELIYWLAVAFVRPADRALVVTPTFGEYAHAVEMMGGQVVRFETRVDAAFQFDLDAFLRLARRVQPRLIFVCNPNNPTGVYLKREVVENLVRDCPDSLVVLDEAFIRFVDDPSLSLDAEGHSGRSSRDRLDVENLVILRSLTKDYALTGLRVGYAMAAPHIVESIEKVQPPWSVNALAQAAAVAALSDEEHLRSSLAALRHAKASLVRDLARLRLYPVPSAVHYFMLPTRSASQTTQALLERNILVRDCTSFGLPTFVRIATRKPEENARLVGALAELTL